MLTNVVDIDAAILMLVLLASIEVVQYIRDLKNKLKNKKNKL